MSETTTPSVDEQGGDNAGATPTGDTFAPITSQDDLNRVIGERIARERAKFADYEDLRSKAAKLDEIEEANKSEAQKAADRLAELTRRAEIAEQQALRSRIQATYGIADEDAELFLTGADAETLEAQAKRLSVRVAESKNPHAPRIDTALGRQAGVSTAQQFADAIGAALSH